MQNTTQNKENTEHDEKPKGVQSPAELDLRDYFAAKALQAIIGKMEMKIVPGPANQHEQVVMAVNGAYDYADAMLEARKK